MIKILSGNFFKPFHKSIKCFKTLAHLFNPLKTKINTGGGIGVLFDLLRVLNKYIDDYKLETATGDVNRLALLIHGATVLRELGLTLGLFYEPPKEKNNAVSNELVGKLIGLLIELRASARKNKDFATADKIRNDLAVFGVTLEDHPNGTEWKI